MALELTQTSICPTFTVTDASADLPVTYGNSNIAIQGPDGNFIAFSNQVSLIKKFIYTGNPTGNFGVETACDTLVFEIGEYDLECFIEKAVAAFNASDDPRKFFVTATAGPDSITFTTTHPGVYFSFSDAPIDGTTNIPTTEQALLQLQVFLIILVQQQD
jgi:hypothetical protein